MQWSVNDSVTNPYQVGGEQIGGYGGGWQSIPPNTPGRVTRVGNPRVVVRFYPTNGRAVSIWVDQSELIAREDFEPSAEKRRKLGTKPEGDEFLDPLDPRLEWFWDDVSTYAQTSGYCGTFDTILKELGLPPRKRNFTARGKIGTFEVTGTVLARTQQEADKLFATQITDQIIAAASTLDPVPTEDEAIEAVTT